MLKSTSTAAQHTTSERTGRRPFFYIREADEATYRVSLYYTHRTGALTPTKLKIIIIVLVTVFYYILLYANLLYENLS